ncbi:MAG: T9SS type A sorting domain-containing protein [Cytophagaceae bacterium]|nr:T9SS type A sorting domain-containing protein [Cytophagaceae bacterium]
MKKLLLSAVALLSTVTMASAQFSVDYASGADLTCLSGTFQQGGSNRSGAAYSAASAYIPSKDYNFVGNAALTFVAGSSTPAGTVAKDPLWFDLYVKKGVAPNATCNPFSTDDDVLDMSTKTGVRIKAKSSVAGSKFKVYLWAKTAGAEPWNANATTYQIGNPGPVELVVETPALTTSYATYNLEFGGTLFASWIYKNKIQGWGVQVTTFDGATISIERIDFGVIITGNTSANVVNDQVALFPNPAKGAFHVDMTAMMNSEAASVKVMNANGLVVNEFSTNLNDVEVSTEGMNKGIYLVQITSGNKIATKKVVVE